MSTSGALLAWFPRMNWLTKNAWPRKNAGKSAFALLAERAAQTAAGQRRADRLAFFQRRTDADHDVHAKGLFFGLTLSHKRAHLYRSCLEGIAYGLRHNIEAMAAVDANPPRLIAIGGGAQDALWLQICSDVTGLPQDVPAETIGAAYGDAYIAGLAAGIFSDWRPLRERWVRIARRVQPNPEAKAIYDQLYPVYRDLYRDNREHMRRLSRLT